MMGSVLEICNKFIKAKAKYDYIIQHIFTLRLSNIVGHCYQ